MRNKFIYSDSAAKDKKVSGDRAWEEGWNKTKNRVIAAEFKGHPQRIIRRECRNGVSEQSRNQTNSKNSTQRPVFVVDPASRSVGKQVGSYLWERRQEKHFVSFFKVLNKGTDEPSWICQDKKKKERKRFCWGLIGNLLSSLTQLKIVSLLLLSQFSNYQTHTWKNNNKSSTVLSKARQTVFMEIKTPGLWIGM